MYAPKFGVMVANKCPRLLVLHAVYILIAYYFCSESRVTKCLK